MEDLIIQIVLQGLLLQYPAWRIYKRAGLNPTLSLTVLIPGVGMLIAGLILAVSKWQVSLGGN
ncbi:hypothetical protein MPL1_02628 [Methylophaga lonarensis MPL]|uniref:Uncharacterized protein n=1 Tax=Methylophaga lonarensis MPL TaxID=1286106 RepID=M7P337_9GAMM|nr:hypothetical protein MPL1_02628 [Methylophaga lonarensis MPL]